MNRFTAIVLAGGSGQRMKAKEKKQFMDLCGKPLIAYSLMAFEKSNVTDIIIVASPGDEDRCMGIAKTYGITKLRAVVPGGDTRTISVYSGVISSPEGYVLIHDSARPFIDIDSIHRCMSAVMVYEAVVLGTVSKDTVKLSDDRGNILDTPNRENVWIAQTPQCFNKNLIMAAYDGYRKAPKSSITDDASLVELYTGEKVRMIAGNALNFKVTEPVDFLMAQALIGAKQGH